ncbi:MAG: M1 family aminopeptidase [Balneolaceae bacterium]
MFWNIFTYEIKHWIKQPITYFFIGIFFLFGIGIMAVSGDILREMTVQEGSQLYANSSFKILSYFFDLNLFILFAIPIFIGNSIYRDYNSNSFMVMYSYPIKKNDYFFGKFFSGLFIASLILSMIGIGLFIGTYLPGLNPELISSNSILSYLLPYLVIIVPNLIFVSTLVFSITAYSRNNYSGFVCILLIFLTRRIILFVLGGPDNQHLITLFDPFGQAAIMDSVQYWSISQLNSTTIPISITLVFNRLIWVGLSLILFTSVYLKFSLSQQIEPFKFLKRFYLNSKSAPKEKESSINQKARLSEITIKFDVLSQLKNTWRISNIEFNSIIFSRAFLALITGSFLFMFLLLGQVNPQYTTRIYPLTQIMLLVPALFYSLIVALITFLYAGVLVHRDIRYKMNQLVDVSAIPSWSLLISKLFTLIKLQTVLLSVIMIVGVLVQIWRGYFNFELEIYFLQIYGVLFVTQIIWALLALFTQVIVPNQYIGFFLLIMFSIGVGGLENVGVTLDIFKFNAAPLKEYSDLSGYGGSLPAYFIHKFYWILMGLFLLIIARLFWVRGFTESFLERISLAKFHISKAVLLGVSLILFGFLGTGFLIYTNVYPIKLEPTIEELDIHKADAELRYSKFKLLIQPRLSGIAINMDIYPEERNFHANGILYFVNKSDQDIDTILVNYPKDINLTYSLVNSSRKVLIDSVLNFDVHVLTNPLSSKDTLYLSFKAFNTPSTIFLSNSEVTTNGTFILADFPSLKYPDFELSNQEKRNTYGLPPQQNTVLLPSDSVAVQNSYVGLNVDRLDFKATVSTSIDQVGLAPGELKNHWLKGDRAYFEYESNSKIRNGIVFNSGKFDVLRDSIDGVKLEIYHHKTHTFNLDRMMNAMKATYNYSTKHFGRYPFKQLRIIEFPKTYGDFAQSFAGTIPFSEFAGFISKQDESENRFDDVLRLTAHEMAHQWWGHQVVPAEALGNRMISEGLAEYTALKVLEKEEGIEKKRLYLSLIKKRYIERRNREQKESPLKLVKPNEAHVHYAKSLLVFNSLNEHVGDELFYKSLNSFFQQFRLQEAPYPTSLDLITHFKEVIPDSLHYLITDSFEKVTFYDNSILGSKIEKLQNGDFQIEIKFNISKFRNPESNEKVYSELEKTLEFKTDSGELIQSLPLSDYIEIGVFDENNSLIQSITKKVTDINNSLTLTTKRKPARVALDPNYLLMDIKINTPEHTLGEKQ